MEPYGRSLYGMIAIVIAAWSVSEAKLAPGNETDWLALLQFKASIVDPLGVLTSWNSSLHFCQWFGVTCGARHRRVTGLNLQSQQLSGTISPYIGNLSFLNTLNLQNNTLHSRIPVEVGRLSRLRVLRLLNNSLDGPIPSSLSGCSNLVDIVIYNNRLEGKLPLEELSGLSKLRSLEVGENKLNGVISASIGNLSSLMYLYLSDNMLEGRIPDALGNLRKLQFLGLAGNKLLGELPSSITNISLVTTFDVTGNQLVGTLPTDLGIALPNIQFFGISQNNFSGPIPKSVPNMTQLYHFEILTNNFTGDVPSFQMMSSLARISINDNHLGHAKANDLNFLCTLINSTGLQILDVSMNNFGGEIPECIGDLPVALSGIWLDQNAISGTMPSGIGNLVNLEALALSSNNVSGSIPPEIGSLKQVKNLVLERNAFTGEIPYSLGNLSMLTHLFFRGNNLSGTIPSSLGNCKRLIALDLADNQLSGAIPPEVMSLSSLSISADFSQNKLSGEIPVEIGKLKNLGRLLLYGNKFSGEIPSSLGDCILLESLYLQENMFTGPIPSALSSLKGLQELNLSHNRLSGQIPVFLENLNLTSLDLSYNNLEGNIPTGGVFSNMSATSILGNQDLCGGLPGYRLPKCKLGMSTNERVRNVSIYTVSAIVAAILVLSFVYFLWLKKQRKSNASGESIDDGLLMVSYQDLLKATDGFSAANLIGTGGFGSVFRGILATDDTVVAVKVLNLELYGASKSFMAECRAIRNIRHRNLVKVLTACSGSDYNGKDFKALVYEFMVNGSLDEWLHSPIEISTKQVETPRRLGLIQRVNIAADVACALEYLHHQCDMPIVHCDLKPSNVLLDSEMTGHVGDFGLVRFMPDAAKELISDQTSSLGVKGSLGYIAPEYGAGGDVSAFGDVYSYGILVLEMFTGRRPTDDMFSDGLNLHFFAKAALPERVMEIIDPILLEESQYEHHGDIRKTRRSHDRLLKIQECLESIVEIGVACSSEVPRDRMSMTDAAAALQAIRKKLYGV